MAVRKKKVLTNRVECSDKRNPAIIVLRTDAVVDWLPALILYRPGCPTPEPRVQFTHCNFAVTAAGFVGCVTVAPLIDVRIPSGKTGGINNQS